MAVGAAASLPRAIAANGTEGVGTAADAGVNALPASFQDAQGREFKLQRDPATGAPQYKHASTQRDEAGTLDLEILITLAQDGGFTRRTSQSLALATGDTQREVVTGTFAPDGTQLAELTEGSTKEGTATSSERTVGTFSGGELVKRTTEIDQADEATNAETGEVTRVGAKILGTWDEGGAPITAATVPHVDRTEFQDYTSPGGGINKDTDRTIHFTRHAAGPVNALKWDDTGRMVVRFNGHGDQYIEREMEMPLDPATGAPDMDQAETIRTDDKQNLLNKGMMQTRVWGGLASSLAWIGGLNFATGKLRGALIGASVAASGAQLVAESHALLTKRNDGDWSRVVRSAYDTLLMGMIGAYVGGRSRAAMAPGTMLAANAAGASSLAMNGAELTGSLSPIGTDKFAQAPIDTTVGAQLLAGTTTALDGDWRAEPRFDAARALAA